MNNIKLKNFKRSDFKKKKFHVFFRYDILYKFFFARTSNLTNSTQYLKCWNCQKTNYEKNCKFCNVLQPMNANDNFFSYLGFPEKFLLDEMELKKRFRNIQANVHPDKFSLRSNREQELADQHSSFLNNAYKILKDPLSRAEYLLKITEKGNFKIKISIIFLRKFFLI